MMTPKRVTPECERYLAALDGLVEGQDGSAELKAHLNECKACQSEQEVRRNMLNRLRNAHQNETAPAYLETRIRAAIRAEQAQQRPGSPRWFALPGWATAAAAVVMTVAGLGIAYELGNLRWTQSSQEAYVSSVANRVASIMRIGLKDHVHCAVFRKYPQTAPPVAELRAELGEEYRELIPVVQRQVPGSYRMVIAHRCKYQGRQYIHVAMKDGAKLMSLVIARKADGESFQTEQMRAVAQQDGMPIYQAGAQRFTIAAFETDAYLVYGISEMPEAENTRLVMAMAGDVKRVLESTRQP